MSLNSKTEKITETNYKC